jgi:hypothetical protein
MRFSKSKIFPYVYYGKESYYFVTRETDPMGKTAYSARCFDEKTGRITTLGEFHTYTLAGARALIKETIKAEKGE